MKRLTVLLPFALPRLTDRTAAQLLELLHQLIAGIEHHYAGQIHRYYKRQREIRQPPPSPASTPSDPPF